MFSVYSAFKHAYSIPHMPKILVLDLFGTFCFFYLPFLPSFGGRDKLKKERIPEECVRARMFCIVCMFICMYVCEWVCVYVRMCICAYVCKLVSVL